MRGSLQSPTDHGSSVLEAGDVVPSEGVPCDQGPTLADTLVR